MIRHTRLERRLTAQLEAAFGRPVEVGRYDFSLWGGPTLEAQSVVVGEDPRFGNEYFLRAEALSVRLGWQSLLRGHLQLGTLSLTRPSLNLVRNADGEWNLAEWLPKPAGPAVQGPLNGPVRAPPALRFSRIDVEAGRINFKRGDEKLSFAFVGVKGTVETESPGRWRMDLEATPSRAAVIVQQAGTFHLTGHIGGTSSRLRPAVLNLSWSEASIADVVRLARSYDYGIHGALALSVTARTEGDSWMLDGRAELRQLHRWDLTLRADNPSVNLTVKARLDPENSYLEVSDAALEAPRSNARVLGRISWSHARLIKVEELPPVYFTLRSSAIDLNDALAWLRAFHSDVADDVSINGTVSAKGVVSGWPLHLENATVFTEGAVIAGARLRVPVHLSRAQFRYDHRIISLLPLTASFGTLSGPPQGSFRIESSTEPDPLSFLRLHMTGSIAQVRDLIAAASSLGWNISRGWDLAGPMRCDLLWQGAEYPWLAQPVGTMEWGNGPGGGSLRAPFLNFPVEQIRARAELKTGARHITLSSAQAFGALWNGAFDRQGPSDDWQFSLSADRLAASDLDRWLNPHWRESLLNRMLPFLNPRSPANAEPENLRASGRLTMDQFTLSPLTVRRLQGDLKIEGRRIHLGGVKGQFYGGDITGSLDADLQTTPAYQVRLGLSRVDLGALGAATPALASLFAGSVSGEVSFHARGASRADLLTSLECNGAARVNEAELRYINLVESLREMTRRRGTSMFREASAAFTCGDNKLQLHDLRLLGSDSESLGSGSIDSNRNLDIRIRFFSGGSPGRDASKPSESSEQPYELTGPLSAPKITRVPLPSRPH